MRARFLGQNITLLGNGIAKLQTPLLAYEVREPDKKPKKDKRPPKKAGAPRDRNKSDIKCP
ncbi:MAG TPA: hypothetical protein VGH23_18055 [Rhizomicrobium sp.]|jgi:hypothetical protein